MASVQGAKALQRRINTIRTKYALPQLIEPIGALLLKRTKDRFNKELTPDYVPWKSLAPVTIADRRRLGFGGEHPILKRKGDLYNSIRIIRGNAEGSTYANTGAGLRIGVSDPEQVEKARVQNLGGQNGRIPARQFLGIGVLDIKAVDSFLRRQAAKLEQEI